jgi:hypothetical protein
MQNILAGLTAVSGAIVDVAEAIIGAVVAAPLLLIPVLTGFIGGGIALFSRLRHN